MNPGDSVKILVGVLKGKTGTIVTVRETPRGNAYEVDINDGPLGKVSGLYRAFELSPVVVSFDDSDVAVAS